MSVIVKKWGNSLAVRLPKGLADACHISDGTSVEIRETPAGLLLKPIGRKRPRVKLKDLLAHCKGPNPHREVFSAPVGREIF